MAAADSLRRPCLKLRLALVLCSVAIGDFNGDGIQDFATANCSSSNVSIRLGDGSGGFTSPAVPEVTVGTNPYSVAIGDFNGDGKQDFAAANDSSNNVSIRLGDGSGGFTSPAVPEVTVGTDPLLGSDRRFQ